MKNDNDALLSPNRWYLPQRVLLAVGVSALAMNVMAFGFLPVSYAPATIPARVISALSHVPQVMTWALNPSKIATVSSAQVAEADEIALRFLVVFSITFGVAAAVAKMLKGRAPSKLNAKWLSGAEYADGFAGPELATRLLYADMAISGPGIVLAPNILLPRNREILSFLLLGRPRFGKSNAIRNLIDAILARPNDKLIVFDAKGDVTAEWPDDKVIYLAPHDVRSWAWAIGHDVIGEIGAREFAASLIPLSEKDPNWAQGGREILIAIVRSLQVTLNMRWAWQDLADRMDLPDTELRQLAWTFYRPALRYLTLDAEKPEFDRTAAGYLATAMAPIIGIVRPLAKAWAGVDPKFQVSLKKWITDEKPERRTLILQRAAHLPSLSGQWITSALEMMARQCIGPALPDSTERRLWFVLDEFSAIPKIEAIPELMAQAPSKGICCILAAQNLELVRDVYGADLTASIVQTTGTQLIFRLNTGPTSDYLTSTAMPKTELRRHKTVSKPKSEKDAKPAADGSEDICVIKPHAISTLNRGEGYLVIEGSIMKIQWPKSNWSVLRPPMIEAAWVSQQALEAPVQ